MSLVKTIDREIAKAEFILSQKKEQVDKISRKMELTEREKIYVGQELDLIEIVRHLITEVKKDYSSTLGKLPPQATDLEEGVLGALMMEKSAIDLVKSFLLPDHFYDDKNRDVYTAILSLLKNGNPIDMRTVVLELRESGKIEKVGGAFYIASLCSAVASAANLEYHARVVVEMAIKRRLITSSSELIYRGYDDTKDCFQMLDFAEQELNAVKEWVKK